ncbi:MAG: ATP-binding protein [Dehalococcoidia bacterium]
MRDFLRGVPLFAELSDADLDGLAESVGRARLQAGDQLFAEGDAGDQAFVVVEGQLAIVKQSGQREVLLAVSGVGEVVGEMALLDDAPRNATARAQTDVELLVVGRDQLDELLSSSAEAAKAMFHMVLKRWRSTEAMLRQSERMAQLGTLTAGVAHELNNPAAAVKRSADQLQYAVAQYRTAHAQLNDQGLGPDQQADIEQQVQRIAEVVESAAPLDPLTRSDREADVERWLEEREIAEPWEHTPALVNLEYDRRALDQLADRFEPSQVHAVLHLLTATHALHGLMSEVGAGAGRISEVVSALRSYAFLDQAPVQRVDVREGIEDALTMLRSRLGEGIEVRRVYGDPLPEIEAYGSELNQVWTNLLDNAIDALSGSGVITVRAHPDGDLVVVEVADDGPGIPPEIQARVFDAFFTTKPVGAGTGLGLDISYNIVVHKHCGNLTFVSEPGSTCFRVELPLVCLHG